MAELTEARKEYLKEYRKKNIRRIPLEVTHEFYARIKAYANERGRSVNNTIKFLLEDDLRRKGF